MTNFDFKQHPRYEQLREKFEELFPKDEEASLGGPPSKSHRSEALVLWAEWEGLCNLLLKEREKSLIEEFIADLKKLDT